jgi:hypothetical protein
MRKRYFDQESVFEHIWREADQGGMWDGEAETLARKFDVSADEAHDVLGELTARNRIQRIGEAKYIISLWPERDDVNEEDEPY